MAARAFSVAENTFPHVEGGGVHIAGAPRRGATFQDVAVGADGVFLRSPTELPAKPTPAPRGSRHHHPDSVDQHRGHPRTAVFTLWRPGASTGSLTKETESSNSSPPSPTMGHRPSYHWPTVSSEEDMAVGQWVQRPLLSQINIVSRSRTVCSMQAEREEVTTADVKAFIERFYKIPIGVQVLMSVDDLGTEAVLEDESMVAVLADGNGTAKVLLQLETENDMWVILEQRVPSFSLGSLGHPSPTCKPCARYWRPTGCSNGANCGHCHMCPRYPDRRQKRRVQRTSANSRVAQELGF